MTNFKLQILYGSGIFYRYSMFVICHLIFVIDHWLLNSCVIIRTWNSQVLLNSLGSHRAI